MKTALTYLGAATSCVLLVTTALAEPEDNDPQRARELRTEAIKAANNSDWKLCTQKASEAWVIANNPITAGLLGTCEAELGEYRAAAEHLDYALRLDDSPERQAANKTKYEAVASKVGILVLSTTPADCLVLSRGSSVGTTKTGTLVLFVDPGRYEVTATKKGFVDLTKTGEVKAGERLPVTLTLAATGAEIPPPTSKKPIWPYIVGASLASIGVGVGIGTAVMAASRWSDQEELAKSPGCAAPIPSSACLSDGQALADEHDAFKGAAIAGFVLGGVFLTGTVIYAAIPAGRSTSEKAPATSWTLVPAVSQNFGGLLWAGSF